MSEDRTKLGVAKGWLDIVQSVMTILALLGAAFWFFAQRSDKQQIKMEHFVTQRPVQGARAMDLVAVEVRVTNVGKVKVDLSPGHLELSQINPVPGGLLLQAPLKTLHLEPGESDQAVFSTYQIPMEISTIQIHSDYALPHLGRIWWEPWTWFDHTPLYWSLNSAYNIDATTEKNIPVKTGSSQ
jgi:hypothetical protein